MSAISSFKVPKEELRKRLQALQALLQEGDIGGALIVQRADLFYFSGTGQSGYLFVPATGEPRLLVRKNLDRAREESGLDQIEPFAGWPALKEQVKSQLPRSGKMGLELDVLPVNLYSRLQRLFPQYDLVDISPAVRKLRALKSPFELELQRKAAALAVEMFAFAREIIADDMTEVELSARLEAFVRTKGHQGAVRMRGFNQEMFYGHIMAGKSAATPTFFDGPTGGTGLNPSFPQGAGFAKIKRNEPILVDFVTVLNGYMVDQTRIFCLGKLPKELEEAYRAALNIKLDLAERGKAGISGEDLYERALYLAEQAGLGRYFMGAAEKVKFIGHGVGIELDELPVIARGAHLLLEEGMVFALEPKFVFPGRGVVGIEDTFVVEKQGLVQLTAFSDAIQYL